MAQSVIALVLVALTTSMAFPRDDQLLQQLFEEYLQNRNAIQGPIEDPSWPSREVSANIGPVSGVAAGPQGEVFLLHRADHQWTVGTFRENNTYSTPEKGPISTDAILKVDGAKGNKLDSLGANLFYLPHGLTFDHAGNLWVTDVALHQVMKIPAGSKQPDLVLGQKFIPGSDDTHFCKPTDVAVISNGDFFVSDGYCNSRIIKFAPDGTILKQWGTKTGRLHTLTDSELNTPHSLALVEERDMICVADRENLRVQCYNAGIKDSTKTGLFMITLIDVFRAGKPYAISYDPTAKVMYVAVDPNGNQDGARGYTLTLTEISWRSGAMQDRYKVCPMTSQCQRMAATSTSATSRHPGRQ
ncbi:peptidyl-glycine alpha-amidating monooxygenase A-like [Gigantopelta aegis]|uniref:peptidyl-glycine alpha-amidating monooxygenase A-like n=1 Tax=Gigantopelta aegis TaxID=1735272 RepID=UPI001B88DAE4|nr:peptidyl-glycine alpha-amidating monooxygenase A-like [Gigantopelta aegis]